MCSVQPPPESKRRVARRAPSVPRVPATRVFLFIPQPRRGGGQVSCVFISRVLITVVSPALLTQGGGLSALSRCWEGGWAVYSSAAGAASGFHFPCVPERS